MLTSKRSQNRAAPRAERRRRRCPPVSGSWGQLSSRSQVDGCDERRVERSVARRAYLHTCEVLPEYVMDSPDAVEVRLVMFPFASYVVVTVADLEPVTVVTVVRADAS